METFEHVCDALESAYINRNPFPYFFAENVFPAVFYAKLCEYAKNKEDFQDERFGSRRIAKGTGDFVGLDFMNHKEFLVRMLNIFHSERDVRFSGKKVKLAPEVRFIKDSQNYKIGPHTDSPSKVISLLFYLPETDEFSKFGTSIFIPKDPAFTCEGGPHYPFPGFIEVGRAPFIPNSCLGFWKTSNSFHGVPPILIPIQRNLLLYNIYDLSVP